MMVSFIAQGLPGGRRCRTPNLVLNSIARMAASEREETAGSGSGDALVKIQRVGEFPLLFVNAGQRKFCGVHRHDVGKAVDDPLISPDGQIRLALGIEAGRHAERRRRGKVAVGMGVEKFLKLRLRVGVLARREQRRRALHPGAPPAERAGIVTGDFQISVGQLAGICRGRDRKRQLRQRLPAAISF